MPARNLFSPQDWARSARSLARRARTHGRKLFAKSGGPPPAYPRKLNFGCGYDKRSDYLNVDVDPACTPDLLIADHDYSAIPLDYFEEVLAKDVIEHVPRAATLSVLLDFASYLQMGGKLVLETSSILHVAAKLQQSSKYAAHHGWTICLFGNQAHAGDFHHTGFTELTLRVHLLAAKFEILHQEVRQDWMFYVEAKKVSDWSCLLAQWDHLSDEDFVARACLQCFRRKVDEAGFRHWSTLLWEGVARRDILKSLYSSPERLFLTAQDHDL